MVMSLLSKVQVAIGRITIDGFVDGVGLLERRKVTNVGAEVDHTSLYFQIKNSREDKHMTS